MLSLSLFTVADICNLSGSIWGREYEAASPPASLYRSSLLDIYQSCLVSFWECSDLTSSSICFFMREWLTASASILVVISERGLKGLQLLESLALVLYVTSLELSMQIFVSPTRSLSRLCYAKALLRAIACKTSFSILTWATFIINLILIAENSGK